MTVKEWTDRINLTVEKDDSGAVRVVGEEEVRRRCECFRVKMAPAQVERRSREYYPGEGKYSGSGAGEIDNRGSSHCQ